MISFHLNMSGKKPFYLDCCQYIHWNLDVKVYHEDRTKIWDNFKNFLAPLKYRTNQARPNIYRSASFSETRYVQERTT